MTADIDDGFTSWDCTREGWDSGPCREMVGELANHSEDVLGWVVGSEDTKTKCSHCFGDGRGNEAEKVVTKTFDVRRVGRKTREKVLVNGVFEAISRWGEIPGKVGRDSRRKEDIV